MKLRRVYANTPREAKPAVALGARLEQSCACHSGGKGNALASSACNINIEQGHSYCDLIVLAGTLKARAEATIDRITLAMCQDGTLPIEQVRRDIRRAAKVARRQMRGQQE